MASTKPVSTQLDREVEQLEKEVECPISLDQFKDPRVLPCMHTYCKHCLEDLRKDNGTIKCPECAEVFQINSVDALKVNFWANRMISSLQWVKERERNGDEVKLICSNNDCKEPAQVRCFDCEKYMCKKCLAVHNYIMRDSTKDHKVMTFDEINKEGFPVVEKLPYCEKHKRKKLKLFCKGCDQLICKDCVYGEHKGHDHHLTADIINKYKVSLEIKIKKANETVKKVEHSVKSVEKNEVTLTTSKFQTHARIDEIIDKQIQALEEKRASLKKEEDSMYETNKVNFSTQKSHLKTHLTFLKSAITFAENTMAQGSNSEILCVFKDITSRLSKLSEKPALIVEDRWPLKHVVQVDEKVQKALITNIQALARVVEFDPLAIDFQQSEVVWPRTGGGCYIHIKNAIGEYMDIDKQRIDVGFPRNLVYQEKGIWYLNTAESPAVKRYSPLKSSYMVKVDGKNIKNGKICHIRLDLHTDGLQDGP